MPLFTNIITNIVYLLTNPTVWDIMYSTNREGNKMDYQVVFYREYNKHVAPSIQWDASEFNPEFPAGVSFNDIEFNQSVSNQTIALVNEYATARETMTDKYAVRRVRNLVEDKIYKLAATLR